MFYFVQVSPRKYVIMEPTGHYEVLGSTPVDPAIARHGKIAFGPADYDTVQTQFIQWTKKKKESGR